MSNSAGQMNADVVVLPNAKTPDGMLAAMKKFQSGITDPAYDLKFGLLPWVKGTAAWAFTFGPSFDETTGAAIAAGTNGNDLLCGPEEHDFINGASETSDNTIPGSPELKSNASNYSYLGGEVIPRGRCFAVVGVMIHAVGANQKMVEGEHDMRVPLWFSFADDSQQLANLVFNELKENLSIEATNDVTEKTYLLGAAKDHKDEISGYRDFAGDGRLTGSYLTFSCPLITADSRSMNAFRFRGVLQNTLRIGTDHSNNGAGAGSLGTAGGVPTLYVKLAMYLVGSVICCPVDKLCDIVVLSQ